MSKAHSINIRVSKQQREMIGQIAKSNGYKNISDYMRARSLCFLACEEKLSKICKALFPDEKQKIKPNGANKRLSEFTINHNESFPIADPQE